MRKKINVLPLMCTVNAQENETNSLAPEEALFGQTNDLSHDAN